MHTHEVIVVYKLPSERAVCMLSMWQGLKAMNSWWPRNEVKRKLTSNDVAIGVNYGVASFSSWFQMWCSWGGFSLFTIVILSTPHERDQIAFISRTPPLTKVNCIWSNHCHRMNKNKVFIIAYRNSYHRLSFEIDGQSTISYPRGKIMCLCFYDLVEVEERLVLRCPL